MVKILQAKQTTEKGDNGKLSSKCSGYRPPGLTLGRPATTTLNSRIQVVPLGRRKTPKTLPYNSASPLMSDVQQGDRRIASLEMAPSIHR